MNRLLKALKRNRKAMFGAGLLVFFGLVALAGPYFVNAQANQAHRSPHPTGIFGLVPKQGEDVFAQTVHGARMTLGIGFIVGFLVTF